MRVFPYTQGTAGWLESRVGFITASRMADVVAKPKRGSEELACRRNYRMELICERLTGRAAEHYVSRDMDFGTEQEPFARAAYEVTADSMVDEAGFVIHPNIDFSGSSPDGLVGDDGCIEIKAPRTVTHLEWRMAGVVPEEHIPQMMWVMVCCERKWCDFISFDPRLPQGLRFFVCRLQRDEKLIAEMELEAILFNEQIDKACESLGAPRWIPKLPEVRSTATERIGESNVPADLMEILGGEIMI